MFKKILIANRGEIALRIIRACKELGIQTVAVYSTADRDSLHVRFADEAVCIGPPPSKESYLNISSIISAAEITGADAIHPGYGFLSENADFAEVLRRVQDRLHRPAAGGHPADGRQGQGARRRPRRRGCRCCPAARSRWRTPRRRWRMAAEVGYPVILKASAGGGGRGMRIVHDRGRARARQFATARDGGGEGVRRRLDLPREVPERAAPHRVPGPRRRARQRRPPGRARVLDPAPAPEADRGVPLAGAHPRAARRDGRGGGRGSASAVGYKNAGTIEFLLDSDGRFYFMEMNTRIQVEHPVTEMVTGIDLVKMQIEVAAGREAGAPATA